MSKLEAEFDGLVRAVANPHRRMILQRCSQAERTAGEIADLVGLAPASVSEHLKVLRKHDLVTMAAHGTFRVYRTQTKTVHRLGELLTAVFPKEKP